MNAYRCQGQSRFLPARGGPRISMLVTNSKSYLTQEGNDFVLGTPWSSVCQLLLDLEFRDWIVGAPWAVFGANTVAVLRTTCLLPSQKYD